MHAFALWTLIIWISFISQSVQQPPGRQLYFVERAKATIDMVSKELEIWNCVRGARNKARAAGHTTSDEFYAKAWISMYSRLCNIDERQFNQDQELRNFPFRLNKELRCSFHRQRNQRIKKIFLRAGNIINEALEVLQPVNYRTALFRGVRDFPFRNQSEFVEEGFTSVSTDINVALHFAKGNVLLIVERVRGVYIADYAQDRFRHQKEVLTKRNSMFIIRERVEKRDLIIQHISNFRTRITRQYPREIIYLYQVNPGTDVIEKFSRAQQSQSFGYCAP